MHLATRKSNGSKQRPRRWSLLSYLGFTENQRSKTFVLVVAPKSELHISLRRFRVNPIRAKGKTINLRIFGLRQVSVQHRRFKRTKHSFHAVLHKHRQATLSGTMTALGLIGVVYFGGTIIVASQNRPPIVLAQEAPQSDVIDESVESTTKTEEPKYLEESEPTSLHIPAIGVRTEVNPVGLLASGELETPDIFAGTVGWYENGPTPGEQGPAVLVGHVDTYQGPSVFYRLGELKIGDRIVVARDDGEAAIFKVSSVQQYDQNNFPTEKVYGDTDYAGLRLITCGGNFSYFSGSYSHNTVVYARMQK